MLLMNFSEIMNLSKLLGGIFLVLILGPASCGRSSSEQVIMKTDMGDITLQIELGKAPLTAGNFLSLVEQGVYQEAIFYRVVSPDNQPNNHVKIEVIQGGLFDDQLIGQHPPIEHESTDQTGILHTDGVISMARMEPGSASTEIFICIGDQPSLDFGGDRNPDGAGFAAFGKVIKGMDVVRRIQALPDSGQYLVEPVRIDSAYIR